MGLLLSKLNLLHTSDWHLGRALHNRKRYHEFDAFLTWLTNTIQSQHVDVVLVAGDIFDTTSPSTRAQELYYRFLSAAAASSCRHVIVIAGNHDSPSFLNAPKTLLKALNVHVIGSVSSSSEDEVIVLRDQDDTPELIVCAVPYLRDRDIRTARAGETTDDKARNLVHGIRDHYAEVGAIAQSKRDELNADIPIVGMGHLFTAGGQTIDGDGVRDLYVGSLAHVTPAIFPECFDYVALGHLHVPQRVGGRETVRYCGSPIPMGFAEAQQRKSVCLVEFEGTIPSVTQVEVPVFQRLEFVTGDWETISSRLQALKNADAHAWLDVVYDSETIMSDLRERVLLEVEGTQLEVLRVKNKRIANPALSQSHVTETLDDLTEQDVFERCLAAHKVPEDQRPALIQAYSEVLDLVHGHSTEADGPDLS